MGTMGRQARPLAAMLAAALMTALACSSGRAQQPQPAQANELAQAQRAFDIPAQPLSGALAAFGQQSGMQVSVSAGLAQGVASPGVSGSMTSVQALDRLLAGTGITYTLTGNTALLRSIAAAPPGGGVQLDPVQVLGNVVPPQAVIDNLPPPYAGGQVATGGQLGVLGERGFMDTPFNQTSYTSKLIQDQQARTVADVLANDPSVRNVFPAASYATPLFVRGLSLNNQDFMFNGMYGVAPTLLPSPEFLERVEVLKGPNAMLNGMAPFGGIGGTINLVPKHGITELNRVTASYISSAQFGGHFDFARRFGDEQRFGVRVNGLYRNGSTPVDRQTQEVADAAFGFDFRGERLRLSLDWGYQKQRYNSPLLFTYVIPNVPVPLAPGGRSNWFQPWTFMDNSDLYGVAKAEFDVDSNWTLFAGAGGRNNAYNRIGGGGAVITDSASNMVESVPYTPSWIATNTQEVGVRGRADTGPLRHSIVLSGTRFMLEQGSAWVDLANVSSNLYQPTFVAEAPVSYFTPPKVSSTQLSSLSLADILSMMDERLQLILGARLQRVQSTNFNATGAVTTYYDQAALSPAVGLIVKPWENVSVYGSFIQGLQQGPTAPAGAINAGQTFAPLQSNQFEFGAKIDFGRFATTLGAFSIQQPFGFTDPTSQVFSVNGKQRNQGLEWTVFGEPLAGFRALGGLTLMSAVLVDTGSPLTVGKYAPGVPGVQLNLGAEWDASFLRGVTFSGRAIYTSLQYVDAANTQSIPSWTRFDAGVRYAFERKDGKPIALRFNVENLFDLNYWASANSTYGLSMGAPRTFLLSLSADF